ncbi:MAG: methionyl-tRNA formyltransferase [bacterium]
MKIIFFGIPDLGAICLNSLMLANKNIVAVVPPKTSHPGYETLCNIANNYNLKLIPFENSPNEPEFIEKIKQVQADIAVVAAFDNLLPKELLETTRLGFLNCHPSLLPKYRGGNPYFHVIADGESKTGITLHFMDETFDTGDIVTQWETDIDQNETFGTLFSRLNFKTAELLVKTINEIESGTPIKRIKQDKSSIYPKAKGVVPNSKDVLIDWSKESIEIERFIRACNPFFGAMTHYRNCPVKIWNCEYSTEKKYNNNPPGTIINISNDQLAISTGNGLIFPTVIQAGMFFTCEIKEFIKRAAPQKGEQFMPFTNLE